VRSGIVLTGGSSRTEGIVELAEEIFHLPVRLGLPNYDGALAEVVRNPIYATGIGLAQFGHANRRRLAQLAAPPSGARAVWTRGLARAKGWLKSRF